VITIMDVPLETDHRANRVYVDDLTGLPNRQSIEETVAALVALDDGDISFALAFIDVDDLKLINEYYGCAVGDGLLQRIARRIEGSVQAEVVFARTGDDEFMLLITPAFSRAGIAAPVADVSERLKQPFFVSGYEIFSSASIGISLYPADGRNFQSLRGSAHSAIARSRALAKGGFLFFDPEIRRAASERMKDEQRLRLALRDGHLRCAFQPQVDFRSGTVIGAEVLLRWCDEDGVVRPPGNCIGLAVELGLMNEITLMVLQRTFDEIDWINGTLGSDISISVNIAARLAGDESFMMAFTDAVLESGHAHRLIVELTEEAFLSKGRFQQQILPMLREAGMRISIDDFGTGYSSLSILSEITADELKIDRSFITGIHQRPRSQAILKVFETLGQELGMSIVAEGVEAVEELTYLQEETQISIAQGYYFARPLMRQAPESSLDLSSRRLTSAPRNTIAPRTRGANRRLS
jgi:diguanylate cyclase (GGDEF)-like protein